MTPSSTPDTPLPDTTSREVEEMVERCKGHTSGPWITQDERKMCDEIWIGAKHPEVGFVSHASVRYGCGEAEEIGEIEANANLIAYAPRILDLLTRLSTRLREVEKERDEADEVVYHCIQKASKDGPVFYSADGSVAKALSRYAARQRQEGQK